MIAGREETVTALRHDLSKVTSAIRGLAETIEQKTKSDNLRLAAILIAGIAVGFLLGAL